MERLRRMINKEPN